MSTRGFIGFKTNTVDSRDGNIYGLYVSSDSSYNDLGLEVLNVYETTDKATFIQIFNDIQWGSICNINYAKPVDLFKGCFSGKKLINEADFLSNGLFCEYGYVYNLENDTLEIYRGGFNFPQNSDVANLEVNINGDIPFNTHKVLTITRDTDLTKVKAMFNIVDEYKSKKGVEIENGKYIEDILLGN